MQPAFEHTTYSTILFMDSMVALEGKPLPTLPWKEIDPSGPILVLVVPQVIKEIDKRKRDGRLAKRAREFNRLVSPAAESGRPARIAEGPPAVDIAVARTARVDWDMLDDLDPDEGDARVVAQILHALDLPDSRKMLLSHDINPIAMASRHGLKCHKMPGRWLREPEPSPNEKEMTRLKARVKELETEEPDLVAKLTFGVAPPVRIFRVECLSEEQKKVITSLILAQNQRINQKSPGFPGIIRGFDYDSVYNEEYDTYRVRTVPQYTASVHRFLESHFGQVPFTFELNNIGHLQAENLVVTLKASGGTIHNRFVVYPLFGPVAPSPRPFHLGGPIINPLDFRTPVVGRHEMHFAVGPNRTDTIEVHCADFRHGRSWQFGGIATLNPRKKQPFTINVCITASNMHGKIESRYSLDFDVADVALGDLIDLGKGNYRTPAPMTDQFMAALDRGDKDWLEFVKVDDMSDEDDDE